MPGRRADISSIPISPAAARASRRAVLSSARGLPAGVRCGCATQPQRRSCCSASLLAASRASSVQRQAGERRPAEAIPQLANWATSPGRISAAASGTNALGSSGGGVAAFPCGRTGASAAKFAALPVGARQAPRASARNRRAPRNWSGRDRPGGSGRELSHGHPQGRRHLEEGPGVSRYWSQLGRRSTKTTVPGAWRGLPLPGGKCLPTAVPLPVHGGQSP